MVTKTFNIGLHSIEEESGSIIHFLDEFSIKLSRGKIIYGKKSYL